MLVTKYLNMGPKELLWRETAASMDRTPADTGYARLFTREVEEYPFDSSDVPEPVIMKAKRSLSSCAEATDDGYLLPSHKYERHPISTKRAKSVVTEGSTICPTCKNEREVVEFNLRKPCPDCAT